MKAEGQSPREEPNVRMPRAKMLGRVQDLIGGAIAAYHNDRAECRAGAVLPRLEEAFDLVVKLRGRYRR
jgi:hypothetical protein